MTYVKVIINNHPTFSSLRSPEQAVISLTSICPAGGYFYLGSGLIDQSQKMTVAAMQMADMKV